MIPAAQGLDCQVLPGLIHWHCLFWPLQNCTKSHSNGVNGKVDDHLDPIPPAALGSITRTEKDVLQGYEDEGKYCKTSPILPSSSLYRLAQSRDFLNVKIGRFFMDEFFICCHFYWFLQYLFDLNKHCILLVWYLILILNICDCIYTIIFNYIIKTRYFEVSAIFEVWISFSVAICEFAHYKSVMNSDFVCY